MKTTKSIPINQDDNLQPRYVVNLSPMKVKLKPNPLFTDYLKTRMKRAIDEQVIQPWSYVRVDHGYYTPEASEDRPFSLRDCFDTDDLNQTLKAIRKGVN